VATTLFNLAYAVGETIGAPAGAALAQSTSDTAPFLLLAALMLLTFPLVAARTRRSRVHAG
jgi:predicted MFS family arabinose efflux permease